MWGNIYIYMKAISVLGSLVVMTVAQLARGQGLIPVEAQNFLDWLSWVIRSTVTFAGQCDLWA